LLLADEPTAALDDIHAKGAIALLTQHAAASDATLVVASHDARIRSEFGHVLSLSGEGRT
jgi:putative ABC transport system ATP-binding protein